jgi:DNA primase
MKSNSLSIAAIKARLRIEEVIRGRGVSLQAPSQGSTRLTGNCPFHQDETPSFTVYIVTQRFHCFGCGANGDVIDFVERFEKCSRQEAMQRLAEASYVTPLSGKQEQPRQKQRRTTVRLDVTTTGRQDEHTELLSLAQYHYHRSLLKHDAMMAHLHEQRGITREGILLCGLGYADGSLHAYLNAAQRQEAREIGLMSVMAHERLFQRVIIPERDEEGWSTWMIGRLVTQEETKRSPKYLGLSLPKPLLGYGLARKRQAQGDRPQAIVVVEGALDYVIATQWLLPIWCVALIGTHASRSQLAALLDLQERAQGCPILLGLDADEAGRRASFQLMMQIARHERSVGEVLPIYGVKDIGELAQRPDGRDLLEQNIQYALTLLQPAKGARQ